MVESKEKDKKDIESDVDVDNDNIITNDNDIDNSNVNRSLTVGPCICDKTYLLIQRFLLGEFDNPDRQRKILTRSPNRYPN